MTLATDGAPPPPLMLPPAFTGLVSTGREAAFDQACRLAGPESAGTLVVAERADLLDFAVVLAPEEPLASARRAFHLGMAALADAVGAHAAPEMPIAIDWPDTLVFDGARLGGGRLGWPDACAEDSVPDWLVFSATLIVSKARAGDPGQTPGSTALDEEGFAPECGRLIVESFSRGLMKGFEVWDEDGFAPVAARYLARLVQAEKRPARIAEDGDVLVGAERLALRPALRAPAWRDPATGTVRL